MDRPKVKRLKVECRRPFDERRLISPQEVIDDLLRQVARQAKSLHEKNLKLGLAEEDGVEPASEEKPQSRPRSVEPEFEQIAEL